LGKEAQKFDDYVFDFNSKLTAGPMIWLVITGVIYHNRHSGSLRSDECVRELT
jgi:hypothetical protein